MHYATLVQFCLKEWMKNGSFHLAFPGISMNELDIPLDNSKLVTTEVFPIS